MSNVEHRYSSCLADVMHHYLRHEILHVQLDGLTSEFDVLKHATQDEYDTVVSSIVCYSNSDYLELLHQGPYTEQASVSIFLSKACLNMYLVSKRAALLD